MEITFTDEQKEYVRCEFMRVMRGFQKYLEICGVDVMRNEIEGGFKAFTDDSFWETFFHGNAYPDIAQTEMEHKNVRDI